MIYFNGEIVAAEAVKIAPNDRGFLLADGLFETMRAYQGAVFCLQAHWRRLKKGAEYLEIPFSLTEEELEKIIRELLAKNNLSAQGASLRLTLTRGGGPRGLLPPVDVTPTILLTALPLAAPQYSAVSVCVVDIRRNELSPLSRIKSLNYLDNVLARMAAVKAGADEAILLNSKGHVAEASAANVFLVTSQRQLVTPRIEDGALPGVTRQVVIDLAQHLNIPVAEQTVTVDALLQANEIFLTNSLTEIQPVRQLNNKPMNHDLQIDSITARLKTAYHEKIQHYLLYGYLV